MTEIQFLCIASIVMLAPHLNSKTSHWISLLCLVVAVIDTIGTII